MIEELEGKSLFIFEKKSKVRILLARLVLHRHFDNIILLFILASTIILALESAFDDPDGRKAYILTIFDIVITSVFFAEFVIKVIVFGFLLNGKLSYLRQAWNVLDFIIVLFSVRIIRHL